MRIIVSPIATPVAAATVVSAAPAASEDVQQLRAEIEQLKETLMQLQASALPVPTPAPTPEPTPASIPTSEPIPDIPAPVAKARPAAKTSLFDPMWSALHQR